jgi:hypothetical protein
LREERFKLEALQIADSAVMDVKDELTGLSRNIQELETRLKEKQTKTDEKLQHVKKLETDRTEQEKMLFIEQERLKKFRGRLQGINVRNPHAYSANQREVDKIKKDVEAIEATLLKIMQEVEDQRKALESFNKDIAESKSRLADAVKFAEEKNAGLMSKLKELKIERDKLATEVEPKALAAYDRIQGRFPRNAVVIARDELCMGCHMHIPAQMFNELQRGEKLITCPNCQRVLLFRFTPEEELRNKAASG